MFVSGERFGREEFTEGVHSGGIDAALHGIDSFGLYQNYADVSVIGVYRWLEDRELALLTEMHQQEAFAPARQLAAVILLIGLISAVVLTVGVYLLARQIAYPILAIANTATRVTAGDLTQTVPVLTQDEIGVLANAFNQMIKQLRDLLNTLEERVAARTRDLQIAADVSKQITTVLEIDELLQRVVTSTARSFNLYGCFVFLLDEENQTLVQAAGANAQGHILTIEGLGNIPIDAEPSVVALAARTYEAVTVSDVSQSSIFLDLPSLPETRSEVAIPMVRGDQLIGVFDLQSEIANRFGEEELRVLTTLAEQIAIAVRNAQLFAEAQAAQHAAEAANRAKSTFLANMSHELRTPLNAILGFTQLMNGNPNFPPEHKKYLETIARSGEHLLTLINRLLALSKLGVEQITLDEQILYDERAGGQEARVGTQAKSPTLNLQHLISTLPPDLLASLEQAVVRLDMDVINSLIEKVRTHNAAVADALATLEEDFKYDEILTIIQEARTYMEQK
jgi:signal transduction histidine kinase